jgi:Tol biopolymer transport system component/DNA-binding winged helix-turn-helix (wHTH) protein
MLLVGFARAYRMAYTGTGGRVVRFGDFDLDLQSGELTKSGSRVLLPDQPFHLLAILIRERGVLVTREDLRRELWPEGTFVDFEPSLNAAVKRVREALGDSATAPRFIETLPRRGYRFIAPVEEAGSRKTEELTAVLSSGGSHLSPHPTDVGGSVRTPGASGSSVRAWARVGVDARWKAIALVLASSTVLAAIGVFQRPPWLRSASRQPVIGRLTDIGGVQLAAISLDGRQVAYVRREGVQESLWLKSAGDPLSTRLLAPTDGSFKSLTFAPGDSLHYTLFRPDRTLVQPFSLSISGGPPEPILEPAGRIAFDRKGLRFAYVASFSLSQRESRIVVSDAIGSETRVVAVRRPPESFVRTKPAWSPDGSRLAVFGVSEIAPASLELLVLDVGTGLPLNISAIDLVAVDSALWLPDGKTIIVAGRASSATPQRLWLVSLGSGSLRPLTADLSDYSLVGFWQNTGQIVAVRSDVARSIWMAELNASHVRQVAQNSGDLGELEGVAWSGEDQILYTASESGNIDIWSVKVDGGARYQLTSDPANDFHPSATADGRTIVFASSRGEAGGIWSMNGEGSEQRRLTTGTDVRPSVSRDGGLLVFQRGAVDTTPFTVWRLPIGQHEPVQLSAHHAMRPAISPDNKAIAHYLMTAEAWMLAITPTAGGSPERTIPISQTHAARVVRWSRDGHALAYIDGVGGASNIWVQPLDGSAYKLTDFTEGRITTFDWSPNGSRLAWIRVNEVRDVVLIDLTGG